MDKNIKLAEKLCIPREILFGEICITLTGNKEAWIENFKGILSVTEEKIILQGKKIRIILEGKALKILYYTNSEMKVSGEINMVSFGE